MPPKLTPIDGDPFAQPPPQQRQPKLTAVNGDPFAPPKPVGERLREAIFGKGLVERASADQASRDRTQRLSDEAFAVRAHYNARHHDGAVDTARDLVARGTAQFDAGVSRFLSTVLPTAGSERMKARARRMEFIGGATSPDEVTFGQVKQNPSAANIGRFILEQGAQSIPSIGAVMAAPPALAASLTGQLAEQRAQNNGQQDAQLSDVIKAAPAAAVSTALDRFGLGKIINPGVGNLAVRMGKAALIEGATEGAQSGVEYAGSNLGTNQGVNMADALDQIASGALVGAPIGGAGHMVADAPHAVRQATMGLPERIAALALEAPPVPVPSAPLEPVANNPQPELAFMPRQVEPTPQPQVAPEPVAQPAPAPEPKLTPVESDPFVEPKTGRRFEYQEFTGKQEFELPHEGKNWKGGPDAKVHVAQDPDGNYRFAIGYSAGDIGEGGSFVHSPNFATAEEAKAAGFAKLGDRVASPDSPHYNPATQKRLARIHQWIAENKGTPPEPAAKPTTTPEWLQEDQPSEPQALTEGEKHVRTPAGNKVRTRMEVVDASTLAKATGDLQNRDRSRDTTTLQVQDIIGKFDPELLGEDPSSDRGAPIVAGDNTVLSGNGRMLALNGIYDAHPDKAAAYRQFIEQQGHSTEGMERPVLIRRVTQDMTPEEARQFVVESNKDNKLSLSPVEKARSDADAVTPEMLDRYAGGDLNSGANTGFVESFAKKLTAGEMGDFIGSDRRLSTSGIERIENAVVAKAYDHPKLLEKLMESAHNEIRAITSSLANVAPAWAKMRAASKAGEIDGHYDITDDLADAAMRVAEARRAGTKPADILSQTDAFDPMSPVTEELIRAFYNPEMTRAASVKSVTEFLRDYIDTASSQSATEGLFGAEPGKAPLDILREKLNLRDNPNGNEGLFDPLEDAAPRSRRRGGLHDAVESRPSPADQSTGAYQRTHEKGATTDRASDLRSAVEHFGMTWDDFNLKSPPTQMRLLQRAINEKLGIKVSVDHGELGASKTSIPYRVAIDQMLDAFHNVSGMAAVLGLPEKAMSLNGTLSLELRKRANFYGAFYPGEQKIALPGRTNSFAHEWGHALDFYLMGVIGRHIGKGGMSGIIRKDGKGEARPSVVADRFTELMKAMFFDRAELATKIMQLEAKIAASKSESTKAQLQKQIERIQSGAAQHRSGRTDFYKKAKAFDEPTGEPGSGYWQKPTEMLARSFEAYVGKKAADAGMSTEVISHADADYLSNADERLKMTFPKDAEREAIFGAFDGLFDAVADRQVLGSGEAAAVPTNPARREEAAPEQVNAFARIVRTELGAFADWRRSRDKAAGQPKDRKSFAQKANDVRHFLFSGMAAEMRAIGRRHKSRAIAELHDLLVSEAGTGRRLQRRDFIMARRLRANRYANMVERALLTYGPKRVEGGNSNATTLSKEQAADVRSMMTDETHQPAFPELKPLASRLREVSDQIWHDIRAAGFNIGYARNGHLPRFYDAAKAEADSQGFMEAARQVYEIALDRDDVDEAVLKAEARRAAADWYYRLVSGSPLEFDQHQPHGDFLKTRELPPEADAIMAEFMVNEPVDLMHRYAEAAAHRIEWGKRFGVDNSKLNALYERMAREHVDRRDIATISTMADIMAGRNPDRVKDPTLNALGAGFNTIYGTVALLGRAVFQSLSESVTSSIVLENPVYGVKAMADLVSGALGSAKGKERRELVEFIGLVDVTHSTRLMADRFGGSYDDPVSFQKINNKLFYNTGLIALTRAQYTHNVDVVNSYLVHQSKKLLSAKEGSADEREVLDRFRELGIRDAKPFAEWMSGHGGPSIFHKTRLPAKAELAEGLEERGSSPWAYDWVTATRRLSERIIQDPHAMTKPRLSHKGTIGRLVTGIQAFNYSFYENVLKPVWKRNHERIADGRGVHASKALAATAAGFGSLYAAQLLATTLRVYLTDQERWKEEEGNGNLFHYLLQRTLTSFIGNPLDPVVQAGAGLKYNRPLGASVEGPSAGNFLANATDVASLATRNSRKTNAAEFNAINGTYRLMSPWVSAGVGSIPGGPIVSGAEGVAQSYITSPQAGRDAATLIVGPKNNSVGADGEKVKSGPTAYDQFLNDRFGEVKRKSRDE